jgi:hypothetical protein
MIFYHCVLQTRSTRVRHCRVRSMRSVWCRWTAAPDIAIVQLSATVTATVKAVGPCAAAMHTTMPRHVISDGARTPPDLLFTDCCCLQ